MHRHAVLSRFVQVAGAGVIAEPRPQRQDLIGIGGSQIGEFWQGGHEALKVGQRGGHLGLLKHDLADPSAVRRDFLLPW